MEALKVKQTTNGEYRIYAGAIPITKPCPNPRMAARELRNLAEQIETQVCLASNIVV